MKYAHHSNCRTFGAASRVENYSFGRIQDFFARNPLSEQIYTELKKGTAREAVVARFSETSVKYTEICIESILAE